MAKTKTIPIEEMLAILRDMPPTIAALTKDLTSDQLRTAPTEGEWSLNEILSHLRSCADVWGDNILTIINEDTPTFAAVNPTTWIKQTDYPQWEFRRSLDAYTTQRAALLQVLEALSSEAWARTATVTVWGKVYERTVLYYAQWMARHERSHIKPLEAMVKAMCE